MFQAGDVIQGIVKVQLTESIHGKSLTVQLQAYHESSGWDGNSTNLLPNDPLYNRACQVSSSQMFEPGTHFSFQLKIPRIERKSKKAVADNEIGKFLAAVDSACSACPNTIKWYVSAHLAIPRRVGLRKQVSISVMNQK